MSTLFPENWASRRSARHVLELDDPAARKVDGLDSSLGMLRAVLRSDKAQLVLVLLACGLPGSAWAQTGNASVTIPNPDTQPVLLEADNSTLVVRDPTLNIRNGLYSYDDCIKDRRIRYQLTNSNTDPTLPLQVWVSQGGDCTKGGNRGAPYFQCWLGQPDAVPNTVQAESILRLQDIVSQYSTQPDQRSVGYVPGTVDDCRNLNNIAFKVDYMFLRAYDAEGTGTTTSITFDTVGPAPPTGVATGVGEKLVEVRWNLPAQNTDVTKYVVYCDDGTLEQLPASTSSSSSSSSSGEASSSSSSSSSSSTSGDTDGGTDPLSLDLLQDETSSSSSGDEGTSTSGGVTAKPGTSTACPPNLALRAGELPLTSWRPCAQVTGGTANKAVITRLGMNSDAPELRNEQAYGFAVSAYDNVGNPGPLSAVICNTPVETTDFFDGYRAAGGQAGGCSTVDSTLTSAAPSCALGFVALALARGAYRRRQRRAERDQTR